MIAETQNPPRKMPPQVADAIDEGRRRFKLKMLRQQCGLNAGLITSQHEQTLGLIADLLPNVGGGTLPLYKLTRANFEEARRLLLQLPQTTAIRMFLMATKNGPFIQTDL